MPFKNKQYNKGYQNGWLSGRKSFFLDGMKCAKCGGLKRLEFDHKNPKKKWKHRFWSYKKTIIEKELKKCQLLCKECHWEKTTKDLNFTGHSVYAYEVKKCRCLVCKMLKAKKMKRDRIRSHSLVAKRGTVTAKSRVQFSVRPKKRK